MSYPETIPKVAKAQYMEGFRMRVAFDDGLVHKLAFAGRLPG